MTKNGRENNDQETDNFTQRLRVILDRHRKTPPPGQFGDAAAVPRPLSENTWRFHLEGRLCDPIGPHQDTQSPLQVIRLMDPVREYGPEEMYGLIVNAEQNGERIELPLDRIDVLEGNAPTPNCWRTTAIGSGTASSEPE